MLTMIRMPKRWLMLDMTYKMELVLGKVSRIIIQAGLVALKM